MKANESLRNQHFEISIYKLIWLTFLGHKITKHFSVWIKCLLKLRSCKSYRYLSKVRDQNETLNKFLREVGQNLRHFIAKNGVNPWRIKV